MAEVAPKATRPAAASITAAAAAAARAPAGGSARSSPDSTRPCHRTRARARASAYSSARAYAERHTHGYIRAVCRAPHTWTYMSMCAAGERLRRAPGRAPRIRPPHTWRYTTGHTKLPNRKARRTVNLRTRASAATVCRYASARCCAAMCVSKGVTESGASPMRALPLEPVSRSSDGSGEEDTAGLRLLLPRRRPLRR